MTIGRIPLYGALKGFAARLIEIDEGSTFRPAILVVGDGERELGYLAEGHGDGNATVKPPLAPTPFSGDRDRLDAAGENAGREPRRFHPCAEPLGDRSLRTDRARRWRGARPQ